MAESKENTEMEIVVAEENENEIDEYKTAFELLEENVSDNANDFKLMLLNARMDEVAVKIKEQCIYK